MGRIKVGLGWAAIICAAIVGGTMATVNGMTIIAALLGLAVMYFAYTSPQIAIVTWVVVTAIVPFWTSVYTLGIGLPPSAAFGLPVFLGAAASLSKSPNKARLHWMDGALAGGAIIILILWTMNELQGRYFLRDLLFLWTLAYILGRMANERTIAFAFPIIMAAVGAWGLIEFAFGMHLFTDWMPGVHTLNRIQERAGVARSEAAFGHAIAYGAALLLALPYAQRLPRYSLLVQLLLIAGAVVSLSRGPLLGLVLTLALCAWTLSSRERRLRDALLTTGGGIAAYFILTNLYSGAYSDEVSGSGNARLDQYFAVQDQVKWLSSSLSFSSQGDPLVSGIKIIDSTPLRLAVNYGIVVAVLILIPVIIAAVRSINRKAGPASVALAGQIPILIVTSFITQWQVLIFFFMGLVTSEVLANTKTNATEQPHPQSSQPNLSKV